ncbi:MAG: chromate transporter [Bordetella sp.]|uniref:chromate transporter n=1 Tax=Bordetella sp. TaxID=28081 RepID=UPI003F7C8397
MASVVASTALDSARRPTSREIFMGFFRLGMISFGGALPLSRRMLVEREGWLTGEEFTELLGLCQFLPGGNIINMSVAVGMKFRGPRGALAGLLGMITMPAIVVVFLGMIYDHFRDDAHVQHLFAGLAAAASGLMIAMGIKVARPLLRDRPALGMACLSFVVIALARVPLLYGMAGLTLASAVLVIWRRIK